MAINDTCGARRVRLITARMRGLCHRGPFGGPCTAGVPQRGTGLYLRLQRVPHEESGGNVRGQPGGDTQEHPRSGAARAAYYKTVSGRLWGDLHGYELCIDAAMGEGAAGLICDYMDRTGRRLFGPPASYLLDGKIRGSFRWKDPRFFTLTEVGEKRPRRLRQ